MYNHPLIVSYGAGVDSTAVLIGLATRQQRPDLILFADTGSEKPETYAYLTPINAWLAKAHFPPVTVVKNARPKSGDQSLYDACHRNSVLPALAYGVHQCFRSYGSVIPGSPTSSRLADTGTRGPGASQRTPIRQRFGAPLEAAAQFVTRIKAKYADAEVLVTSVTQAKSEL